MAYQCCRDSVAMWCINHAPVEGAKVECRWGMVCVDGYAIYRHGDWDFHDELSERIRAMTSPEAEKARRARYRDILGHDLQKDGD